MSEQLAIFALCECGCGAPVRASVRFHPGHYSRTPEGRERCRLGRQKIGPRLGSPEERFARYVGEPDERGCFPWLGCRRGRDYGGFWVHGRMLKAHRYAYERVNGPLAAGLHLHHVCRNTLCVNPAHLIPLSPSQHSRFHEAEKRSGRAGIVSADSRARAAPLDAQDSRPENLAENGPPDTLRDGSTREVVTADATADPPSEQPAARRTSPIQGAFELC